MKKKSVKLLSSLIVLGILCGGYYGVKTYVESQEKKEQKEKDKESEDEVIFTSSAEAVKSITFLVEQKEITFDYDREKDLWTKRDEAAFPVNQEKLSETAGALSGMNAERVLENVDELEQYGLETPQNTITITAEDETAIFKIGSYNENISQYYIAKEGENDKVYLVAGALIEPFLGELYDYAQGEAFPVIESTNINDLKVDKNENPYILSKNKDTNLWNVSSDGSDEKADSAKAVNLTSSVAALTYDKFIDYDCSNLNQYGLETPYASISLNYDEEVKADTEENGDADDIESDSENEKPVMEEKRLTLYIGDQTDNESRYARLDDSKEIYTISEELLSSFLDKTAEDLWDLSLNYTALKQVERVKITYDGVEHTIDVSRETSKREDGETKEETTYLLDGDKLEDETVFSTFYNKLYNMSAQKILLESFEPETSPEMTTEIVSIDGKTMKVDFYSYDTNFYAAEIDNRVYLVNKVNVKDMFETYASLVSSSENLED